RWHPHGAPRRDLARARRRAVPRRAWRVPRCGAHALRQPLEEGVVRVSRARASVEFPARFLLVAAMNPCPCGAPGGPGSCRCSDRARARCHRRVSGPLLDRFDLRIEVQRPATADLLGGPPGEPSAAVAARVAYVRDLARMRGAPCNAMLTADALDEF